MTAEGPVQETVEVWVVGQPDPHPELGSFPPYAVHWTDASARKHGYGQTALEGAQAFVQRIQENGGRWLDGPRVITRRVSYGPWEEQ